MLIRAFALSLLFCATISATISPTGTRAARRLAEIAYLSKPIIFETTKFSPFYIY